MNTTYIELVEKVLYVIKWVLQEESPCIQFLHQNEHVVPLIDVEDDVLAIMKVHSYNESVIYLHVCKAFVDKVYAVEANSRFVRMLLTFFFSRN